MADENKEKTTNKPAKKNGFQKFLSGIAGIPKRIQKSVMATWFELKKVTWPTKKELINYSVVVLVFIALLGVLVGLLDLGASAFIRLIIEV
ncbi:MAG: preprotein translocase subunit SecE [Oscillospiraceae bacterium]|jgi:preprotein translocase subunit SecE|nr:preprotein translocase subunit SecE [Oscillospiraceae bacterium]